MENENKKSWQSKHGPVVAAVVVIAVIAWGFIYGGSKVEQLHDPAPGERVQVQGDWVVKIPVPSLGCRSDEVKVITEFPPMFGTELFLTFNEPVTANPRTSPRVILTRFPTMEEWNKKQGDRGVYVGEHFWTCLYWPTQWVGTARVQFLVPAVDPRIPKVERFMFGEVARQELELAPIPCGYELELHGERHKLVQQNGGCSALIKSGAACPHPMNPQFGFIEMENLSGRSCIASIGDGGMDFQVERGEFQRTERELPTLNLTIADYKNEYIAATVQLANTAGRSWRTKVYKDGSGAFFEGVEGLAGGFTITLYGEGEGGLPLEFRTTRTTATEGTFNSVWLMKNVSANTPELCLETPSVCWWPYKQ